MRKVSTEINALTQILFFFFLTNTSAHELLYTISLSGKRKGTKINRRSSLYKLFTITRIIIGVEFPFFAGPTIHICETAKEISLASQIQGAEGEGGGGGGDTF